MQVYDIRNRERHAGYSAQPDRDPRQLLDDGAFSPYGVACLHEQRRVIEVRIGHGHQLLSCAECSALLGVVQYPAT